jgi:thiol:disulfide interchange protein
MIALALALAALPAAGSAAPMAPYSREAFTAAQNAGKPIVVFVHAGWCITCRRQEPTVKQLTADPAFASVVVLVVDYDKDKAALKELNAPDRSTLLAFNGKAERKRASFVTDPAAIRALFESAL